MKSSSPSGYSMPSVGSLAAFKQPTPAWSMIPTMQSWEAEAGPDRGGDLRAEDGCGTGRAYRAHAAAPPDCVGCGSGEAASVDSLPPASNTAGVALESAALHGSSTG